MVPLQFLEWEMATPSVGRCRSPQLSSSPGIPEYLREAACHYQNTSIDHARATINLSLSVTAYCEELSAGVFGNIPGRMAPKKFVMKVLTKDLPRPFEKSFASRLFAVNELCEHAELQGLTLDCIRSQGALFALAALVKRAAQKNLAICLKDAIDDASTLTITSFRRKWQDVLELQGSSATPAELKRVLKWISQAQDRNSLRKVAAATYQRLAVVANSQRHFHGASRLRVS
jgi:hypothetical protein